MGTGNLVCFYQSRIYEGTVLDIRLDGRVCGGTNFLFDTSYLTNNLARAVLSRNILWKAYTTMSF